jgi:hypothetical protein
LKYLSLILLLFAISIGEFTLAADEADEVVGETVARIPSSVPGVRNGVSRKRYAGGADEDDLQVQATLPIPTRTFDGAAANAAVESGAAEAAPAAATD